MCLFRASSCLGKTEYTRRNWNGDLIDGSVAVRGPDVAPLADLRSRHGTFFCTGNHEYYSGVLPWLAELEALANKDAGHACLLTSPARDGHCETGSPGPVQAPRTA